MIPCQTASDGSTTDASIVNRRVDWRSISRPCFAIKGAGCSSSLTDCGMAVQQSIRRVEVQYSTPIH
jgi:hypothetical protein